MGDKHTDSPTSKVERRLIMAITSYEDFIKILTYSEDVNLSYENGEIKIACVLGTDFNNRYVFKGAFEAFLEELSSEYEFKPKNLYNIQKLIDGLMPILKSYEKYKNDFEEWFAEKKDSIVEFSFSGDVEELYIKLKDLIDNHY